MNFVLAFQVAVCGKGRTDILSINEIRDPCETDSCDSVCTLPFLVVLIM